MKIRRTITMIAAGLLAAVSVAWAADQYQSPTNDQSSGYSQPPAYTQTPNNNYNGRMAYGQRGCGHYGCYSGGSVYQAAPGNLPQGFWRGCEHWFGWMKPWHSADTGTSGHGGCCW